MRKKQICQSFLIKVPLLIKQMKIKKLEKVFLQNVRSLENNFKLSFRKWQNNWDNVKML